jgi:hypothetical protein
MEDIKKILTVNEYFKAHYEEFGGYSGTTNIGHEDPSYIKMMEGYAYYVVSQQILAKKILKNAEHFLDIYAKKDYFDARDKMNVVLTVKGFLEILGYTSDFTNATYCCNDNVQAEVKRQKEFIDRLNTTWT